ncbi:MAG TPA: AIR synthase related protein, partial [Nitrospirota bacterium]
NTVVHPGSDAGVVRVKDTGKALAMATDCNSRYCYLDPLTGGAHAVAESARNVVCSGGRPQAITDCLNFGNPEKPEIMWQFKEAIEGISTACEKLGVPVISGNVSFYNETKGTGIYPTPVIGMVGIIDDVNKAVTLSFKDTGDSIILLGDTLEELGGTEYLSTVHGLDKGMPPTLDLGIELALHTATLEAISEGLVKSAHDCSDGGLAIALAESCFRGNAEPVGCSVELSSGIRKDALIFGESQSRIILSSAAGNADKIIHIMKRNGVPCSVIGKVGGASLVIKNNGATVIDKPVSGLKNIWLQAIPGKL